MFLRKQAVHAGHRTGAEREVALSIPGLTAGPPPRQHYLCCSDVPVPRISVIFSLEELKDIEKDCAIYVGRMERVARHSSLSKEEKVWGARVFACAPSPCSSWGWPSDGSRAAGPEVLALGGLCELPSCSEGAGVLGPELPASCVAEVEGALMEPPRPNIWCLAGRCEQGRPQRTKRGVRAGVGEEPACLGSLGLVLHPIPSSRLLCEAVSAAPGTSLVTVQDGHFCPQSLATVLGQPTQGPSRHTPPPGPPRGGGRGRDASIPGGLFQELRMEIAKQELIVHAREAASRVLSALSGACGPVPALPLGQPAAAPHSSAPRTLIADRQMSERMALDARKREQFQRLKEQFMRDQEVGGLLLGGAGSGGRLYQRGCLCGLSCSVAGQPGRRSWMTTSAMPASSETGRGG